MKAVLFDLDGTLLDRATSLFVGDNPNADIEGAKQVGMKAIWKRSTDEGTCRGADATCDNLRELPAIIRQL